MKLDVKDNLKVEHAQVIEEQQEYKFIGTAKYRKGLTLYALNPETLMIYIVPIVPKKAYDITKKKEKSQFQAQIDPKHVFMYALNIDNVIRKMNKIFGLHLIKEINTEIQIKN